MPKFEGHPLVRPPRGVNKAQLRRYADGRWKTDNGDPALVFIEKTDDVLEARIYIAFCDCPFPAKCPLGVALDYASDRYDATNIIRRVSAGRVKKARKR